MHECFQTRSSGLDRIKIRLIEPCFQIPTFDNTIQVENNKLETLLVSCFYPKDGLNDLHRYLMFTVL